jgi:diguanylate cyclase (GGDEF)-like protein
MPILDLSSEKRRKLYLIAFPIGAFLLSTFVFFTQQKIAPASTWIAFGFSCILLVCTGILFWQPRALLNIEILVYFLMTLFFPIFAAINLNNTAAIFRSSPEHFGEVINGMALWEVILFVGAFLAISQKAFKTLVALTFASILVVGTRNLVLLYLSGRWETIYLFHWIHGLFAMSITVFLMLRIGRLLQFHATTDLLTGTLNRREASNVLLSEYERAVRYKTSFSVILIDIDHFKLINDTFGHPTGDQVLKKFANVICKTIRKTDYVARWGGEEFLVILPYLDLADAKSTAERIREISSSTAYGKVEHITVSLGVAAYKPGLNLENILSCVDHALYRSKNEGRNRVSVCENTPL